MRNIVLIGFMGAGKTTIGQKLSRLLKRPVYDADDVVVELSGRTIKDMFKEGEEVFRDQETKTIEYLSKKEGIIISCGGGVIKRPENIACLQQNGTIFFLNRDIEEIAKSVEKESRPMLHADDDPVHRLHKERLPLYLKYADYIVPVDDNFNVTAKYIAELVKKQGL